jgi:hypothetical protein
VRRIGWRTAARLVDGHGGGPDGGGRAEELRGLLALAAAPPPAGAAATDTAQFREVLTAFRAAAEDSAGAGAATLTVHGRPHRRPVTHSLAARCAAVALVVCGGGLVAAGANVLPTSVQRLAHQYLNVVGVPAPPGPSRSPGSTANGLPGHGPSAAASARPTRSADASATAGAASGIATPAAAVLVLCTDIDQTGNDWAAGMSAADQATLIAAAGGDQKVKGYCNRLLAQGGGAAATPQPSGTASSDTGSQSVPPSAAPSPSKTRGKAHATPTSSSGGPGDD